MLEKKTLKEYLETYPVEWFCNMPQGCPPEEIAVPSEHAFYRLAYNADSYSAEDFRSYAEMNPQKDWGEMLPLAVGLSVIDDVQKAKKKLKLPMMKMFNGIISLLLNPTDGVVKQSGSHKSHYTWWRTTAFNDTELTMVEL